MTVKYLIAVVGLFLLTFSACQRTPTTPADSPSKADENKTDSTLNQPLATEEQAKSSADQTDTVTSIKKPKPVVTANTTKGNDAVSSGISKPIPQGTSSTNTTDTSTTVPDIASTDISGASTAQSDSASADTSGTPASAPGDPSVTSPDNPTPLLKDEMGKTKFTVKQLMDSGLLGEGGSNAYYSYITYMLNKTDKALKNSASGQAATDLFFLCNGNISECIENGLSLEQLNKPMIMRLIHVAGQAPSKFYKTEDGETFFVLQGEQVTQDFIKDAIKQIKQAGSNKILVNLSQIWNDLNWFFDFGSQLKEEQIDLHIVGQCSGPCANYSIHAANKVVMEPYGHIGYNGNFSGLLQDMETVYSAQLETSKSQFEQEHFSQNEVEGLINLFDRYSGDLRVLMFFNQTPVGDMLNQVSRLLAENRASSFWDLSREGKSNLLSKIRQDVRDILKTFFFDLSGTTQAITGYYTFTQNVASAEADYYEASQMIPDYLDFVNLTAWLNKNMSYAQFFSLPRPYYNIPEKDKPYVMIFPSTDILRDSGINIEGENNTKVPRTLYEGAENIFLFLSADDMKNCNFFAKGISFTTETLKECLSKDGSLL